jgi:phosphoglycerate dehydrogenase-like enzyme
VKEHHINKALVVVDPHFRRMSEIFCPATLARLDEKFEVAWGKDRPMPLDAVEEVLPKATAIVCGEWRYGNLLRKATSLRGIFDVSGGFPRNLDYAECFARQIRVLSVAPCFARVVAEMALGMTLAASRGIASGDRAMRTNTERWLHAGNVGAFMLYDKPVGFVGYGSIARTLQPLLNPFGCKTMAYDPWLSDGYLRSQGVEPASLEQLLENSKVIFVLAVPTAENHFLLSRRLLERIQPGAVLVVVSRAHVLDFDALTELVLAGRFQAAIDVFPMEPLDAHHPIREAAGAVLSAHRAGAVHEALRQIGETVVDDLEAISRGLPPQRMQVAQPELISHYTTTTLNAGRN